jgi:hypothetical protein
MFIRIHIPFCSSFDNFSYFGLLNIPIITITVITIFPFWSPLEILVNYGHHMSLIENISSTSQIRTFAMLLILRIWKAWTQGGLY